MASPPHFHWKPESIAFSADLPVRFLLHSVESISFHSHAAFELLVVVTGRMHLYTDQQSVSLGAGDIAIVHGWQPHATQQLDPENIVLALQIDPAMIRHDPHFGRRRFVLDAVACSGAGQRQRTKLRALMAEAYLEMLIKRSGWQMKLEAIVLEIVTFLLREVHHYESPREEPAELASDERSLSIVLQRVAEFIRVHATDDLSIEEVARLHRISSGYLSRLFKSETGSSFKSFLTKVRLWRSLSLLSSDQNASILSIALATGFPNLKSYNLAFRRAFGDSPGAWRKRRSGIHLDNLPYKPLDIQVAVPILETYLSDAVVSQSF